MFVLRSMAALAIAFGVLAYVSTSSTGAAQGPVFTFVSPGSSHADTSAAASATTSTPIKHLVVIFQENVSFDHYFATYPNAANPPGEPPFHALPGTPSVNGLSGSLLTNNPNLVNPFRLDRSQAITCDQGHGYTAEQKAYDGGRVDKFVQTVEGSPFNSRQFCPYGIVMAYYDGNTVTGYWNYAQHYAMNDNSFSTVYGPSTPGVLNLIAADTYGAICGTSSVYQPPAVCSPTTTTSGAGTGTVISDSDPYFDKCSSGGIGSAKTIAMSGRNSGDMLNSAGLTWGWFQGGFDNCSAQHPQIAADVVDGVNPATDTTTLTGDYNPHHQGFQYYPSTSNAQHALPSSTAMIGKTDQAVHQYDLTDFWSAADSGNMPAVTFLKAANYQDGHAGYSNPLDEQQFVVETINHLESLPSWSSTAVVIAYDDSDGWYDHVMPPSISQSATSADFMCGSTTTPPPARCGYGPRQPLLVISPYAKSNAVDHTLTDQSSITRFIEDNWLGGLRASATSFDNKAGTLAGMFDFTQKSGPTAHQLFLDPTTGEPLGTSGTSFAVTFSSKSTGPALVNFGSSCSALVETATRDLTPNSTNHTVLVTGNDLPGTVGNNGLSAGVTYYYETIVESPSGAIVDNNGGSCYKMTVPSG